MKNRSNLMLRLASFLFVAVLASTVMLSGLLARYTTSGTGSDEARVIKFNSVQITENKSSSGNEFYITPGVDITKDVEVSFGGSEAATYVFVKMDISGDWITTDNYNFAITSDTKELMTFCIDKSKWTYLANTAYVYYAEVNPNDKLEAVDVLTENGKIFVSRYTTMEDLATMTNVDLDFQSIAVQANGFKSVSEAWASVNDK